MPFSSRPGTFKSRGASAPPAQQNRGVLFAQVRYREIDTNMGIRDELDALASQLFDAPVNQMLFHLEVRNAVAQQAADAIRSFRKP